MADQAASGPAETGAPMDYEEHERTYEGFIFYSQVGAISCFNILVSLVLFAFGGGAGFWLGTLVVLLTLIAAAIGFGTKSWKPVAGVFVVGALFVILTSG